MKRGKNKDHMQREGIVWDMLYLAVCALHQETPDNGRVSQMDLNKVYQISKYHGMAALTCMVLEEAGIFTQADPSLVKKWKELKEKAIRKNMLLDAERGKILGELEKMGIWHVPLKGILLQAMYPKYGMRQMSDNDILYDVKGQKKLIAMMKKWGYKVESNQGSAHDVFTKPPIYNFEMHKSLFSKSNGTKGYLYYKNIKDKLVKDEQSQYGYRFTDEDFYIYQTAHAYKHYMYSGTGMRSLMDLYVYIQKKGDSLDWAYIERELAKMDMAGFEKQCRSLAQKIFAASHLPAGEGLTAKEQELFAFFAGSGTYGTMQTRVEHKLQEMQPKGNAYARKSKRRYLYRRVFPDMEWFQNCYPFLAKHKVLIPFFILYRIVRGVIFRRKAIASEFEAVQMAGGKKGHKE